MVLKKEKKPIIDGIRSLEILATCEVMDINIEQLENTKERVNKELNEVIGIIKKKHKKKNRKNLSFEYIDKLYKASTPKNEREVMKDEWF